MSEKSTNPEDYRGQTAEDFKKTVTGEGKEQKKVQEPESNESGNTEGTQASAPQDANVDQKDVSVLSNTFGVDYESLPEAQREGILKVAKSYREAQAKYTSVAQKAKEAETALQTLNNYSSFLEKNPDLYQEIENRLSGNQTSGEDTPSKPQPTSVGKSATVEIDQLKSGGYIDESDLVGLDELAKERVVAKAELAYLRDQELAEFRKGMENEKKKLSEAERAEKVKQTNTQRINEGVDRVVQDYGVDFTSMDDETMDAIQKRALSIFDPSDPTRQTIDKDAMYDATVKELAIRGKLPQRQPQQPKKTINGIVDTGVQVNKRGDNVAKTNTREQIYQQKMAERRANLKDTVGTFASN